VRVLCLDAGGRRSRIDTSARLTRFGVGRTRSRSRWGLGGERFFEALASWDAFTKEASPSSSHLLVDAIEQPDEESLQRSEDGEEDLETGDNVSIGHQEHQITEDPGETDGDIDGDIDAEFLLAITLIGLRSTSESFVNFSTDEEEKDTVRGDDDETGDEEAEESPQIRNDPALGIIGTSTDSAIREGQSSDETENRGEAPAEQMVPFFEQLRLAIPAHNHLVEVERNAERPAEVGNEEEVHHNRHKDATSFILRNRCFVGGDKHRITDDNAYA